MMALQTLIVLLQFDTVLVSLIIKGDSATGFCYCLWLSCCILQNYDTLSIQQDHATKKEDDNYVRSYKRKKFPEPFCET